MGAVTSCSSGNNGAGSSPVSTNTPVPRFAGTVVSPELHRPDLTLPDTAGNPYRFRDRTRGRITVLFFGYTNCRDICPATMATLATALRQLEPAVRRLVTVVFVTEDPARDTPRQLRRWLDQFGTNFVGLIGGNQTTQAVLRTLMLAQTTRTTGSNDIAHSGVVFLFNRSDTVTVLHTQPARVADIAADLRALVTS